MKKTILKLLVVIIAAVTVFSTVPFTYAQNEKNICDKIKNGDILNIKISSSESYDFVLKKKNCDDCLISEDFNENGLENWYGNLSYNATKIERSAVKISDFGTYNSYNRRYFVPQNDTFVIEYSIIYNYNASTDGTSKFISPAFFNEKDIYARMQV